MPVGPQPVIGRIVSANPARVSRGGLAIATQRTSYVALAMLTVLFAFDLYRGGVSQGVLGFDLAGTLWDPAVAILDGRSPYPEPVRSEVEVGNPALYPPLTMLVVAPLTVLPWSLGVALWTPLLAAAVAGSLYVLGVRDIRCYALAFVTLPVAHGLVWGNATLMLLPLVALAWQWRDRWLRSGALVGIAIAAKLFLWPLVFWLIGTRRYRAAGAAAVASGFGVLLPWAVIGFDGLSSYRDLLRVAEEVYGIHSYSIATALSAVGVDTVIATRATLAVGLAVAVLAFAVGRRGMDEISLALLAAILGSPIVWEHYSAFLLVPLAIARPRFSGLWLLPVLFYITHRLPRPHLLANELEPGGTACCKPDDVPLSTWVFNHAPPGLWPAAGHAAVAIALVAGAGLAIRSLRLRENSRLSGAGL